MLRIFTLVKYKGMVRTAKNLSNRTFSEMLELANRDKCESLRSRENWKPGHNLLNFAYL